MQFQSYIEELNEPFNALFMKHFKFVLGDKTIRSGRLKLFTMKEFNLKFYIIDDKNNIKQLEIPYPFELTKTQDGYIFDYTLDSLNSLTSLSMLDFWEQQSTNKNRLYNKVLKIYIT